MKHRLEMPFLLTLSMGCFAIFSAFFAWVTVFAAISMLVGKNPTPNALPQPFGRLILALELSGVVMGTIAGIITYAIWHERPWSRDLIALWFGVGLALAVLLPAVALKTRVSVVSTGFFPTLQLLFSVWYLYRKRNVCTYYEALEAREVSQLAVRAM